jgi:hypothetical protein
MHRIDRFRKEINGNEMKLIWDKGVFPSPAEIGRAAITVLGNNFETEVVPVIDGESVYLVLRKKSVNVPD